MVAGWVKQLTEEVMGGAPFKVGDIVKHPDGHLVKITSGQFWGEFGVSNFWYWKRISKRGVLSKKEECGYGWRPE